MALEDVAKAALELAPDERLTLAGLLLQSAEEADPDAEVAWEEEIKDRIRAIDEGKVVGVAYEEVLREIDRRLAQ
jgi:putative addiction module component (TIGR02574 family)